jgi:hypothetical protein
MAGPSKKMHVSDEEVLHEMLQESEYSSDSEINVKISSWGEQSVSSDECSVQHGIWVKSGAKRPCFPFTGKPGIDVDLEDPSNPLEYSDLFCTPEIAELIARETN